MAKTKVAVSIDRQLMGDIDGWVASGEFASRSSAVEEALRRLQAERAGSRSLLRELARLDRDEEQALADERLSAEPPWPAY